MIRKYTIILDYNGGLYISQVFAKSELDAVHKWVKNINISNIPGMNDNVKDEMEKTLKEEDYVPVELHDLNNVFCTSCTINDELYLINIIETVV